MKSRESSIFLRGLQKRDVTAFRELYQRYYKPLVLSAMHYLDDVQAAEDIVEDVIVAVWERAESLDSVLAFEGYVYNSVRNKCINVIRHRDVHAKFEREMIHEDEAFDADSAHEFEMQYVRLFEAMDNLPARCREVMELYIEGMSNAEIAERMELSVETVKTHRKRALAILRDKLAGVVQFLFFLHLFAC